MSVQRISLEFFRFWEFSALLDGGIDHSHVCCSFFIFPLNFLINFIFPFPALESRPKRYSDIIYQRAHPLSVQDLLLSKVAGGGGSF